MTVALNLNNHRAAFSIYPQEINSVGYKVARCDLRPDEVDVLANLIAERLR